MSSYVAEWISNACDTSLSSSVIMLDTVKAQALETKPYDEIINVGESQILYLLIDYLIKVRSVFVSNFLLYIIYCFIY